MILYGKNELTNCLITTNKNRYNDFSTLALSESLL